MGNAARSDRFDHGTGSAHILHDIGENYLQLDELAQTMDCANDDDWFDVEISDGDLALVEQLLIAVARDDVCQVKNLLSVLPRSHLSLDDLSFRDTESDEVFSLLGIAMSLNAEMVAELLISHGLLKSPIVDECSSFH
jgi:hypothetical protein